MGIFVDPEYILANTQVPALKQMDTEDIERRYIRPAEASLEEEYDLDLDTDADPRRFAGFFDIRPEKRTEFQNDMKSAIIILVDHKAANPHRFGSQSSGRSSVTFSLSWPPEIAALVSKWGRGSAKTGRLFRT